MSKEKLATLLDFEKVEIARIQPNPWNPNKQSDREYEALKLSIKERGFTAPLHVREMDDKSFQIIGGYHRWKAWKELGNDMIWVINEGKMTDLEAKTRGLQDNLHGENAPVELARLIVSMEDDGMSLQQIATRMGQPQAYLQDVKELVNLEPGSKELREALDRPHIVRITFYTDPEPKDKGNAIAASLKELAGKLGAREIKTDVKVNKNRESIGIIDFGFTEPQAQIVNQALEIIMESEDCNKNRALELMSADYIAGMQPKNQEKKK